MTLLTESLTLLRITFLWEKSEPQMSFAFSVPFFSDFNFLLSMLEAQEIWKTNLTVNYIFKTFDFVDEFKQ
jgi:hypothetical protein